MKKIILSGAFALFVAVAAEAQVIQNPGQGSRYSWSSGYGYGYRRPGYTGGASQDVPTYGPPVRPGYYSSLIPGYWGGSPYSLYGRPVIGGTVYGYPSWRRAYEAPPRDYAPLRPRGVADRAHEVIADKDLELGKRHFKRADYAGAVERFRSALLSHLESGSIRAWFAVALVLDGDGANADKALRAAVERAPFRAPEIGGLFKDAGELARAVKAISAAKGPGALARAWVRHLLGEKEPLKQLAGKDETAKKLLD